MWRREGIYYQLINSSQSDHHSINSPRSTCISAFSSSYTAYLFSYHSSSFFYASFLSSAPSSSFPKLLFFSHLFILPLFIHLFTLLPMRQSLHSRIHPLHPSSSPSFFSFSQSTDITSSATSQLSLPPASIKPIAPHTSGLCIFLSLLNLPSFFHLMSNIAL